MRDERARLTIDREWNGAPVAPEHTADVSIHAGGQSLRIQVDAPFYGDPPPPGPAASTEGLWRYEVVELFLVSEATLDSEPDYLEFELSPHSHFLILRLTGVRQRLCTLDPRTVDTAVDGDRWSGRIEIANTDLPARPWRVNAFAIHGSGAERRYLAAAPLSGNQPDFHQPRAFPPFDRFRV